MLTIYNSFFLVPANPTPPTHQPPIDPLTHPPLTLTHPPTQSPTHLLQSNDVGMRYHLHALDLVVQHVYQILVILQARQVNLKHLRVNAFSEREHFFVKNEFHTRALLQDK